VILLKKKYPRNDKQISVFLISDHEKSRSFRTIKKLIHYLKISNSSIATSFHDVFNKETTEHLKNRLNKQFDVIIISLTKSNLLNLMGYDFFEKVFNGEVIIYIFGAKSAWIDLKLKYKKKILCYERKGVSKTSRQFIEDITDFIIHKQKGLL